jgi:hypothetical protein
MAFTADQERRPNPRSAVAERTNIKSRALAVIDAELRRRLNRQMPLTKEGSD